MKKLFFLLFFISTLSFMSFGQLTVQNGQTGQQLGEVLAGDNIQVANASISGDDTQHGTFSFTGDGLDVNSGVILSTGSIFQAVGPNSSDQTTTVFGGPGNALLTALAGQQTLDATVLQFDFDVQSDEIEFNFIFLSEEYNEYVGTQFNDVFAFYISGPGIDGEENLAIVPGTTTPVSINTINNNSYWQFFHDNTNGNTNIEFDGFTTLMTARKSGLQSCETYTLKLMIADAGDGMLDAGVLLQENSLVQASISASSSTYSDNNTALEGCIDADFTFELDEAVDYDVQIPITIGGTAINGVDYKYIDPMIIIPAGQTCATIIIESYSDGMTEGQETIEISYIPSACQAPNTVSLFIDDFQPIEFNATETGANCNGTSDGEVLFSISGGFAPYLINLTDTITNETTQYAANPIVGVPAGTYLVEIIDSYGCKAEDVVFGDIFNAGTTFLPTGTGVTYETSIEVTGFDDGELIETIDQFNQISATMEHSYANDISITLRAPDGTEVLLKDEGPGSPGGNTQNCVDMGEPVSSGSCWDDWNADNITPGIGYEYVWNNNATHGTMTYEREQGLLPSHDYTTTYGNDLTDAVYFEAGSYESFENLDNFIGVPLNGTWTIIVTDFYIFDNGYIFEWNLSISSPQSDSIITITEPDLPEVTSTQTQPDCGSSNGAIDITVTDYTVTNYLWSNSATTEDITGLSSGIYTVNITGDDGCDYDYDFNLSNNGSLALSAISEPVSCIGASDGSIDLSVTGGTPNFNYSWNNGGTTEDISGLAPGDYTVTVTDASGCTGIETFDISDAVEIIISENITHENCGDREGEIDLTISGGVEPYTFVWSNGETTEDITDLQQGDYTVTVTDANNCTSETTYSVINYVGNCIPDCDLEITNFNLTDETCGQADGEIDVTIFTSFSPYTVQWTNGATTDDITNLSADDYSITITDAEGCELIQEYSITNQTNGLEILGINTTDETCGNVQGAIDLTVNGGALPYSFNWSNGEITEDLTNLNAGDYSVIITDANGCSVNSNVTLINDAGDLNQTWSYTINETCGNSEGSIDITIEGGNPFHYGSPNGGYDYYLYDWSNGATTKGIQNLSAGDYFCIITDEDGCQITTETYTVENEGGDINIDYIDIDNEICENSLGEISLDISGGTLPYTFNWNTGQTTQNIANLSAGTYNNTITDANGCSISTGNLSLINESGTLTLDGITTTNETCNNNLGAIDLTITGGTLPYNYIWNTGSSSEDLSGMNAGNYNCTITDANGCQVDVNTTINNDNGAIAVENIIITNETCGNTNGAVDIVIVGATNPVTYNWNSGQTTEDLSNISAGNYDCVITDNVGCQTTANATVLNNAGTLSLDNSIITNEQCGDNNGSINLVVSGDETPITFNWDNGETTEDISGLSAGNYSCIITDNVGCTINTEIYTINNTSSAISVNNAIIANETCGSGNGSIDISITGGTEPITYLWNNGASTQDLTDISAGTYIVTITDNTGCSIDETYDVINDAGSLEIISFSTTNEICGNGNGAIDITVNGADPISYSWNNGSTNEDISGIDAGTYSVAITDNNGCEITSSDFNILNDAGAFAITTNHSTDEFCNDASGTIDIEVENGTEPITYNWSNGATTQDLAGLSQGTYTCIAVDANGCELNYNATILNQGGDLALSSSNITDETCGYTNGAIDITMSGTNTPFTYLWSNGSTNEDITNLDGGNYSCTITDNAGCYITINETIADISGNFSIINSNITDEYCDNTGGIINISVSGGQEPYSYNWDNGETTEDLSNLSADNYSVTITDDIGCETQNSYTIINNPSTLNIDNVTITDENCGNGQGAIDITISGANINAYFNWSNGETTEDLINLSSGNYDVIITDEYGCSTSDTYIINNETFGFIVQNIISIDEECGNDNGSIDLTITGGTEPYTFAWSNGATTEDLTDIDEGIYSCEITDNAGCTINVSETIANNTNGTTVDLVSITNDECSSSVGSINITPTGGNSPYTFLWNTGATTEDLNNIISGTYFVTITDNTGCSATSENFSIINEENEDLGITNIFTQPDFCGMGDGMIDFDPLTPGSYNYKINGTPGNPPFMDLVAGDYTISIIDGNCQVDEIVTVESDGFFNVGLDNIQNEICGQANGLIDIYAGGGGPGGNFDYLWSNGETSQDITNLVANDYSCQITHVNSGCVQTKYYTIENIVNFSTTYDKTDATCDDDNGAIDLTIEPAGTYSYNWNNGATSEDLINIAAGSYSCIISDTDGCEETITEEIFSNFNILNIDAEIENDICENSIGRITLTITGAPIGYSVLWDNYETTNYIENLSVGTYSVTITDTEFGCQQTESYTIDNIFSFAVEKAITNSTCQTCEDGEIDITLTPADGTYSFTWSNGASTEDISGLLSGEYTVTISDEYCLLDSTYFVDFEIVNIHSKDNYSVTIYPNPAENYLNILYDFANNDFAQLSIYNEIGQEVDKIFIDNSKGKETINIENLPGGVYFIKFIIGNETKTIKFIKK